jgi:nucleotide-binding universal stress UspA family protein
MSTIVIGIDESARSEDALAFGRRLALASGADVVLVCAFAYDDVPSIAANPEYRRILAEDAERTLRHAAGRMPGVPAERVRLISVPTTSPARALHEVASDEAADLVVVGSTHTGHLGRVLPGATAERFLHGAPCAVAVAPQNYRTLPDRPWRTLGAAYDGSPESEAAARAAADAAGVLSARLRVIEVMGTPEVYAVSAGLAGGYAELREDVKRGYEQRLDALVGSLPGEARAEGALLEGEAVRRLADASGELDLLVAGSRGYGPLRAVLLGGVTGRLIHEAACPLVIVPRGVECPLGSLFAVRATASA